MKQVDPMSNKKNLLQKTKDHFKEISKNKRRLAALFFISFSFICLFTMLVGAPAGSVEFSKLTFDESVSKIIQRKSIKFTLLGYCIDDQCTKELAHNFDKAPTSNEILSGEINKRSINEIKNSNLIDIPSEVDGVANDAKETAGNVGEKAEEVAKDAGEAAKDAGEKAGKIAKDASNAIVSALLSAFDTFKPEKSTNGDSGWIARPVIVSSVFDFVALILILIANEKIKKYCHSIAFTLLLSSIIISIVSFAFCLTLFFFVFNVIGAFPGLSNNTGPAIYLYMLSIISSFFAISFVIIDSVKPKTFKSNTQREDDA